MRTIIRYAKNEDYTAINLISNAAFSRDYNDEEAQKNLSEILLNPQHKVLVAETDGSLSGFVHASEYLQVYEDKLCYIVAIAVDEKVRGHGIGKKLLEEIEEWAKGVGCRGMNLISGVDRVDAHSFYFANGYKLRKEQKNIIKKF